MQFTKLIIVLDSSERYGIYYKARHAEIAKTLLVQLDDYQSEHGKLNKVGTAINFIDPFEGTNGII